MTRVRVSVRGHSVPLTEAAVARLLERDAADVARASGLLRLEQRDTTERVYPLFQFAPTGQVPGVAEVVSLLLPVLVR